MRGRCFSCGASGTLLRHPGNVHIQIAGLESGAGVPLRWAQGIWPIPPVVGVLALRVVHPMKLPEHAEKIGLTMPQMAEDHLARAPQSTETQVFAVQNGLRLDQFAIKLL